MTDATHSDVPLGKASETATTLLAKDARTNRRNRAEARFRAYGIAAIALGLIMLIVLVVTIVGKGAGAYTQTFVSLDVELLESKLDKKGSKRMASNQTGEHLHSSQQCNKQNKTREKKYLVLLF